MATFKIPSLDFLADAAKRVLVRFPFTSASAIALAILIMTSITYQRSTEDIILWRLMIIASLGIPLFTALHLWLERQNFLVPQKTGVFLVALGLLSLFAFSVSERTAYIDVIRFVVFGYVSHLLVAFLPFYGKKESNAFWQFNLILFARVLLTMIYCIVLEIGILGAMGAVQALFGLAIDWKIYAYIATFISIVLSTFIFLAGMPSDLPALEGDNNYPEGIKFFTQYALIPIISLYGVILYAYELMILGRWNLPKGLIIGLLIGFTTTSIFALLLIHPIRERTGNQWIKIFGKTFYIAILPLLILYFVAIGRRISEYGLTESRYFVFLAGLWMVGIAVYFIISKQKEIIYIPITLALAGVLSVVGPWSAFSISTYSQAARFGAIAERNGLLHQGKIDVTKQKGKELSEKDAQELKAIVGFLAERRRTYALQSYFKDDLSKLANKNRFDETSRILALMGDANIQKALKGEKYIDQRYYYAQDTEKWQKVEGYQYAIPVSFNKSGGEERIQNAQNKISLTLDRMNLDIVMDFSQNALILKNKGKIICTVDLNTTITNLAKDTETNVPIAKMTLQTEGAKYKVNLSMKRFYIAKNSANSQYEVTNLEGTLLCKIIE